MSSQTITQQYVDIYNMMRCGEKVESGSLTEQALITGAASIVAAQIQAEAIKYAGVYIGARLPNA